MGFLFIWWFNSIAWFHTNQERSICSHTHVSIFRLEFLAATTPWITIQLPLASVAISEQNYLWLCVSYTNHLINEWVDVMYSPSSRTFIYFAIRFVSVAKLRWAGETLFCSFRFVTFVVISTTKKKVPVAYELPHCILFWVVFFWDSESIQCHFRILMEVH